MKYDVVVIGGGISGLTAGSLLAKRGLSVAVVDKSYNPGGTCGIFKRGDTIFDQGAAMLYGFGENGFNAHRFIFNCLEEPIDMIRHDLLYCVNFKGKRIKFYADIDKFADELSELFPAEKENIHRFYHDMYHLYHCVMIECPSYTTADESDPKAAMQNVKKHPMEYLKFLGFLNKSAKSLLKKYFKDPEIFKFFDKLTSTYCYTTVAESPAVLAAVMFVDNHVGGSYYPAGSTLFLPGKLEKVIEENGGDMILQREVVSVVFDNGKPCGVKLENGEIINASYIIYSGTVWNLYSKLIDPKYTTRRKRKWAANLVPTYPSVVLYSTVDKNVIPEETAPIEMLVGNPDYLDESEVTAYILSIDDKTLCKEDEHTVVAIGPTKEDWNSLSKEEYRKMKDKEIKRLIAVLEKRFPGFGNGVRYAELATPRTIERYTMKNGGAVAGPKQMLGQHMFKRQHTRTKWDNFFCCGESTVMGTGTPTVSVEGLAAANAVLKKAGKEVYAYKENMKNYVNIVEKPFTSDRLFASYDEQTKAVMKEAMRCRFCEHPTCSKKVDTRGIMRRVVAGNFEGAEKCWEKNPVDMEALKECENNCILKIQGNEPVKICDVVNFLKKR